MSTMTTLSQLHQEVAQLEARASAAEARATAAEEELKRYQRADNDATIRAFHGRYEYWAARISHDEGPPPALESFKLLHDTLGELLDIARQQRAEIDHLKLRAKLDAEYIETLKKDLAWERDCVVVQLQERLREYEDKTEPQPKVEPELLEKFESLQDAPKEEAYRAGLPPEALRKAWPEWEDSQGDRLRFTEDGERFGFLTLSGAAIESESTYIAEDSNGGQFAVCKHRPHGATWFEVEQRAARLLGQAGAKAGRDRMSLERLWTVIGAPDHDGKVAYAAYHAGYDGAIEYRDACNGGLLGGERYRVFQELGCEWEYTPKYEAWRPTLNGKPIPWSRVGG